MRRAKARRGRPQRSRWLAVAGYTGLGLGCLLLGAVTFLLVAAPVDLVRDRLIEQVKSRTGRDLVVSGPTSLVFFPRVAISLGQCRLLGPARHGRRADFGGADAGGRAGAHVAVHATGGHQAGHPDASGDRVAGGCGRPAQLGLRACPAAEVAGRAAGANRRRTAAAHTRIRSGSGAACCGRRQPVGNARDAVARQRPHRRRQRALRRRAVRPAPRRDGARPGPRCRRRRRAVASQGQLRLARRESGGRRHPVLAARPGRGAQGQAFAQARRPTHRGQLRRYARRGCRARPRRQRQPQVSLRVGAWQLDRQQADRRRARCRSARPVELADRRQRPRVAGRPDGDAGRHPDQRRAGHREPAGAALPERHPEAVPARSRRHPDPPEPEPAAGGGASAVRSAARAGGTATQGPAGGRAGARLHPARRRRSGLERRPHRRGPARPRRCRPGAIRRPAHLQGREDRPGAALPATQGQRRQADAGGHAALRRARARRGDARWPRPGSGDHRST